MKAFFDKHSGKIKEDSAFSMMDCYLHKGIESYHNGSADYLSYLATTFELIEDYFQAKGLNIRDNIGKV